MTTRYRIVEPVHVEDDAVALIANVTLGDNIERALLDHRSPFAMMMERAREAFLHNVTLLIDADLNTTEGVALARIQQAEVRRYKEMCQWIDQSLQTRAEAQDERADSEDEEAIPQEVKELHYGDRAKPAHPDA